MKKTKLFCASDDGINSVSMNILEQLHFEEQNYEVYYISPRRESSAIIGITINGPIYRYIQYPNNYLVLDGTPRDNIIAGYLEYGTPDIVIVLNSEPNLTCELGRSGSFQFVKDYREKNFIGIILNSVYERDTPTLKRLIHTALNLVKTNVPYISSGLWNFNLYKSKFIKVTNTKKLTWTDHLVRIDLDKNNIFYRWTYTHRLKLPENVRNVEIDSIKNGYSTYSVRFKENSKKVKI